MVDRRKIKSAVPDDLTARVLDAELPPQDLQNPSTSVQQEIGRQIALLQQVEQAILCCSEQRGLRLVAGVREPGWDAAMEHDQLLLDIQRDKVRRMESYFALLDAQRRIETERAERLQQREQDRVIREQDLRDRERDREQLRLAREQDLRDRERDRQAQEQQLQQDRLEQRWTQNLNILFAVLNAIGTVGAFAVALWALLK